jgi:predicted metal-binding membrane protein
MNLAWIVGIALYVAAEKLLPFGRALGRAAGVALCAAGALLLVRALVA